MHKRVIYYCFIEIEKLFLKIFVTRIKSHKQKILDKRRKGKEKEKANKNVVDMTVIPTGNRQPPVDL